MNYKCFKHRFTKKYKNCFLKKIVWSFLNRADEFFVVTNGLELEDHIQIQKILEKLFDIHLTISIGYGESPFEANLKAHEGKKNGIILNKEHSIFGFVYDKSDSNVSIMHLDVDDLTSKRQTNSPYEISSIIFEIYSKMSKFFLKKNSLTFFMGGDNFMVIASNDAKNTVQNFIDI